MTKFFFYPVMSLLMFISNSLYDTLLFVSLCDFCLNNLSKLVQF